MKYRLRFSGRKVGALGIGNPGVTTEVEADNPKEAALKAYDTHEHIWGGADGVLVTSLEEESQDAQP